MVMSGLFRNCPGRTQPWEERHQAIAGGALTSFDSGDQPIIRFVQLLAHIPRLILACMIICWHRVSECVLKLPTLPMPATQDSDEESDQAGEYGLCDVVLPDDGEGPYDLPSNKDWEGECEEDIEDDDDGNGDDNAKGNAWNYRSPPLYGGNQ
jgi:hypothetical protein